MSPENNATSRISKFELVNQWFNNSKKTVNVLFYKYVIFFQKPDFEQ